MAVVSPQFAMTSDSEQLEEGGERFDAARDARTARAAAARDATVLRDLLGRLTPRLRAAAWNLGGAGQEPQDLVQEALLKITSVEVLGRYRAEGPLDGYLLAVGVRTMISATRRGRTDRERSFLTDQPEQHAGGRDDVVSARLSGGMRTALLALPERARAVVLLVAVGDLGYAEVATTLGMEVGTVKSTYSRARSALRAALAEQGA
jgi:RNA polymerase sigma-70 factor (ECF subfamily)